MLCEFLFYLMVRDEIAIGLSLVIPSMLIDLQIRDIVRGFLLRPDCRIVPIGNILN
jgi:hypothetical protein